MRTSYEKKKKKKKKKFEFLKVGESKKGKEKIIFLKEMINRRSLWM